MTEARIYRGIRIPAPATLEKYGLSEQDWRRILRVQGGRCGVCKRGAKELPTPKDGGPPRLNIDHEHVRGWAKMAPEERRLYVRGALCTPDNHWVLTRYADAELHRAAADYLDRFKGVLRAS